MNAVVRERDWHFARPLAELVEKKALLARVAGRQIALFETAAGIRACDNRCPHEGYPLSEGTLSGECLLTVSLWARINWPSLPVTPIALPPLRLMEATISLLTLPPSTISTASGPPVE